MSCVFVLKSVKWHFFAEKIMSYKRKQLSRYCLHKSSGRAFVRIGGIIFYLGKYGSPASREEYDRIIAVFVAGGSKPLQNNDELTVDYLIVRFLDNAEKERNYTRSSNGGWLFRCGGLTAFTESPPFQSSRREHWKHCGTSLSKTGCPEGQ